jgi:hypothetical protein
VLALRETAEKLSEAAHLTGLPEQATWLPADDPHRGTITALTGAYEATAKSVTD